MWTTPSIAVGATLAHAWRQRCGEARLEISALDEARRDLVGAGTDHLRVARQRGDGGHVPIGVEQRGASPHRDQTQQREHASKDDEHGNRHAAQPAAMTVLDRPARGVVRHEPELPSVKRAASGSRTGCQTRRPTESYCPSNRCQTLWPQLTSTNASTEHDGEQGSRIVILSWSMASASSCQPPLAAIPIRQGGGDTIQLTIRLVPIADISARRSAEDWTSRDERRGSAWDSGDGQGGARSSLERRSLTTRTGCTDSRLRRQHLSLWNMQLRPTQRNMRRPRRTRPIRSSTSRSCTPRARSRTKSWASSLCASVRARVDLGRVGRVAGGIEDHAVGVVV